MSQFLLRVENIQKRFGGVRALKGVSFGVGEAEVIAIIGENGAGKSTLMKTLGGVHTPDEGQIFVDDAPVTIGGVTDSMNCGIAFIHQELNVLDNLDVAANVFLGREPLKGGPLKLVDQATMRRETEKYLAQLGLRVSPDTPLSVLSIAEQQMVEIAKALSQKARLIIMDEPTSSLTLQETARLLEVIHQLKASGVSVIYISHRLGEIIEIADRVVALRDGANAGELAKEEITHDRMVSLMVGRDLERFHLPHKMPILDRFVTVKNLRTRRYPNQKVSFDIGRGEILGFAGLVGAGRSEVAQALFGVETALEGKICIGGGEPFLPKTARQAIDLGVYLVPEDRRKTGLILDFPIRDNISLPAVGKDSTGSFLHLVNRKKEGEVADAQRISLGIKTPTTENRAGNLSGGNQQKVVLAKFLSLSPRLMIFDEPTRGIDVGAKSEIYKLMRALAENGIAVIMISSDMEEVLGVADRIAVMCEGALTGFLTHKEASEETIMKLAVARSHEALAA
ncbi:monosaccharide ABC transporter ATP-binding protein, CUT2 family [Abditibacterium utsteinense]|uniref:Monosaccharide ABC transporter ATP-binding protein, CUT2 family n=1 Tax=Abditibacterium utsteinense TaxID=1960156 RepID=A0A2S8SSD2_9BACT|nr:sugar ABC transporter ATP-binding protein [Abditibacterium utsteinense]PQV63710.1 monosaccharide ABC transporter ATP-binding protein, CUT2 family [Abditibacterium utsteinense]